VQTINKGYDRLTSRVLIRDVSRPTRANLDYAAYWANMILRLHGAQRVEPGQARIVNGDHLFGGALELDTITASRSKTLLHRSEMAQPLAFAPLVDYLARWNVKEADGLERARSAVQEETWGLKKTPGTFFQQITTAYLHRGEAKGGSELWVKVEFEPWARLFRGMADEDGDGFPEFYARLAPGLYSPRLMARIQEDYQGRLLSTREVHTWANELASYWYPSFNTDVFRLQGARAWPTKEVEPTVRAALGGLVVENPTMVIRGKPRGEALYNVFVVPGIKPLDGPVGGGSDAGDQAWQRELKQTAVSARLEPGRQALEQELRVHGKGSYQVWAADTAALRRKIRSLLRRRPVKLKALRGRDGFLFYRKSLDYVAGGDIQAQPPSKNPFKTIVDFKDYLQGLGVDFLLVPVPTKAEVFPDKLQGVRLRRGPLPLLNPYGRKFLLELNRAGVEVTDLLPAFLRARQEGRKPGQEPLYQPQDTHWTDRGLRLAAKYIAERIKQYPWYAVLQQRAVKLGIKESTFKRFGDLHSRLSPGEQRRYEPATLRGRQVITPQGKLYEDDPRSPVVMLGDSFTGVYQRTYCSNAGVSAHLAREINHPVDLVMSYGGGPNVRHTLLTRGEQHLKRKRLLIWIFAARDLYNYWEDWEPLKKLLKAETEKSP